MNLSDLYWFIATFIIIYLFYFFYQIRKKEFNQNKIPVELMFLLKRYRLDMSKIKYSSIMQKIAIVSAFDIAFTATVALKINVNIYLQVLISVLILIPLILITYTFIGLYYKKRGLVINGNKKN